MKNPSESQRNIIESRIGEAIQVLASAGTGKTYVLTERVRHILENTKKDGVIALTFTNKAAEEMRSRLEDLEDIERRCWIATVHSVAQRVLEQYGHTIGLPSDLFIYERSQDLKAIFLQSLRENGINVDAFLNVTDKKLKKDREAIVQERLRQFSIVKRELLSEEEIKSRFIENKNFISIFNEYQRALIESGGIDFDDILVYAHKVLLEQPWCAQIYRSKYKHICVDEAQDLNRAQYEFIKAICGDSLKSVLMVGDPNQMIYGFNSSSHDFLCESFIHDFAPLRFKLKENFRCSRAVIRLANCLKQDSQVESDFVLAGRSEIVAFENEEDEAQWICQKISSLLNEKKHPDIEDGISLDKMVVIARNQFVFNTLQETLRHNDIPFHLKNSKQNFNPSSTFGKILDLSIRFRLNPRNWVDGKKLCSLLKINKPEAWGNDKLLETFSEEVHLNNNLLCEAYTFLLSEISKIDVENPNVLKLCRDMENMFSQLILSISDEEENEIERSLQELKSLRKCWINFKLKGLGESLGAFRNALAMECLTDDSGVAGIGLSTLHTMKGLEKDIVFLMGMCEGVFPDYRARTSQEIEEERNSAFVAVTRSKRWIYISYPKKRTMPWGKVKEQRVSRFLEEMQDQ